MANNNGWIKIHRQIQDHWIWQDANKLKWWLDMLLTVNNSDGKVNFGYDVLECKRGESLLSISSWAERWRVSKDTARNFLTLLEKEKMISRVSLGKTTRITICKYDDYQMPLHVNQTHSVRDTYTNNNNKKNKNITVSKDTVVGLPPATTTAPKSFEERCRLFIEAFNATKKSKYQLTDKVRKKLKARLANYNSKQIMTALKNAMVDPHHRENNFTYVTPEFILREDILERYLNTTPESLKIKSAVPVSYTQPVTINHDDML